MVPDCALPAWWVGLAFIRRVLQLDTRCQHPRNSAIGVRFLLYRAIVLSLEVTDLMEREMVTASITLPASGLTTVDRPA